MPGSAAIKTCFFRGNLIGEPTAVLFRNKPARPRFNELYAQAFDMGLWMRLLADGGKFAFLPQPLCRIRLHGETGTAGNLRGGVVTKGKARLFEEYAAGAAAVGKGCCRAWSYSPAVRIQRRASLVAMTGCAASRRAFAA